MFGIFLDTETNGLNFYSHRVLEIAFQVVHLETSKCLHRYESIVKQPMDVWQKSNPESLKINGFTLEKMQTGKEETQVAEEMIALLKSASISRDNAVFICQNPSFDRAFFAQLISPDRQEELRWPYHWLDLASMYWSFQIQNGELPWIGGVSKNQIAEHFHIQNESLPHKAMSGVEHLLACYHALFKEKISS